MLDLEESPRVTLPPPFTAALASRVDVWSKAQLPGQARTLSFTILAEADADILSRLLGYFAQLQLVPQWLESSRQGDELLLRVRQDGLTLHRAEVIAQKMRSLVSVFSVDVQPAAS
ncbi:hypothetical protein [Pseudomonas sp. zfem005]|uniref:hypothetical protein n=1 Tax=Pseudomonas sp. zfem005 TaxID=3078200 RepID=UPI0029294C9A|nr:hypothetical protein [Pseudomonas sp. zfem005]MDU9411663.1 hypothetical protein [Pseudomonas sp. zfem005]